MIPPFMFATGIENSYPTLDGGAYRVDEMDKELEAARSLLDPAARLTHYKRVHEIAEATVPVVPLYQVAILYGARKELRWTPTPNESFFINRMKWED